MKRMRFSQKTDAQCTPLHWIPVFFDFIHISDFVLFIVSNKQIGALLQTSSFPSCIALQCTIAEGQGNSVPLRGLGQRPNVLSVFFLYTSLSDGQAFKSKPAISPRISR